MNDLCPNCGRPIDVWEYFWSIVVTDGNTSEFEYTCEHCETLLKIDVIPEPVFNISLAEKK